MIESTGPTQGEDLPLSTRTEIEAYCDGSVASTEWANEYFSRVGSDYVGRGLVLIPELDRGLIAQSREGMVTAVGDPRSSSAEGFAVTTALRYCRHLGLPNFVVYTDCMSAVDQHPGEPVRWCSQQELGIANVFLRRILGRAAYLRQSEERVANRRPLLDYQIEYYELFNASYKEFRLSSSAAWQRVLSAVSPADQERFRVPL